MPGTEPEADDLEALANQVTDTTPTSQEPASDPVLDALKPSGHAEGAQQKAAPTQDWEKRYKAIRPEFDKTRNRMATLESIVKDPRIAELAKTDPKIAQALAKAGIQLAKEEAQADGDGGDDDEAYFKTPEGRADVMEAALDLRFEMEDFAVQALGRRFTADEAKQVKHKIGLAPKLTVEEAWSLTPAGKAMRLQAEQKRLADAQTKGKGAQRPRPTPNPLGGGSEKLDLKKHPSQFTDAEKREFLRNLPE